MKTHIKRYSKPGGVAITTKGLVAGEIINQRHHEVSGSIALSFDVSENSRAAATIGDKVL